jgi:hypothetical protein
VAGGSLLGLCGERVKHDVVGTLNIDNVSLIVLSESPSVAEINPQWLLKY